jgi:hypothetical protein
MHKPEQLSRKKYGDSATLKLCFLLRISLAILQLKTLLEEKSVIVELGESHPESSNG